MKMKVLGLLLCFSTIVHAQQKVSLYPVNERTQYIRSMLMNGPLFLQEPMPAFSLVTPEGKKITKETLKGKVVLLDFWATWCAPCRIITHEIDSALATSIQNGKLTALGVNYNETLVNKGKDPVQYWKESKYAFPMTKNDDAFGKSLNAGNPTVMLLDEEGVVRGRWDAWTPNTIEEIAAFVWMMTDKPEVSENELRELVVKKEWYKALHTVDAFLQAYPDESSKYAIMKFNIAVQSGSDIEAFKFIKTVLDTTQNLSPFTALLPAGYDTTKLSSGDKVFEALMKAEKFNAADWIYSSMAYEYAKSGKWDLAVANQLRLVELVKSGKLKSPMRSVADLEAQLAKYKKHIVE